MASSVIVDLYISSDEYLKWYAGNALDVVATARDGRRVRFPAKILQKFIGHEGICGTFVISYDNANKFECIERL